MKKILTIVAVLLAVIGALFAVVIFRRYSNKSIEAENNQQD